MALGAGHVHQDRWDRPCPLQGTSLWHRGALSAVGAKASLKEKLKLLNGERTQRLLARAQPRDTGARGPREVGRSQEAQETGVTSQARGQPRRRAMTLGEWRGAPDGQPAPGGELPGAGGAGSGVGAPRGPGRRHLVGHGLQLLLALPELLAQRLVLRVRLLRLGFLEIHLSS